MGILIAQQELCFMYVWALNITRYHNQTNKDNLKYRTTKS